MHSHAFLHGEEQECERVWRSNALLCPGEVASAARLPNSGFRFHRLGVIPFQIVELTWMLFLQDLAQLDARVPTFDLSSPVTYVLAGAHILTLHVREHALLIKLGEGTDVAGNRCSAHLCATNQT